MLGRRVAVGDSLKGDVCESVEPLLLGRSGDEADSHVLLFGGEGVRMVSNKEA
jgi:hypothetical protein